jgi:hypothetical protein
VAVGGVRLRLVDGEVGPVSDRLAPAEFEALCVERWEDSLVARSFSRRTIDGAVPVLERFLARCGRPVWLISRDDIDG